MKSLHVLLAALLAGVAVAQQSGSKPANGSATKPVDRASQRAREMRDQIKDGRVVTSHVKVRVKLKNGNRLTGVVKDGRLVERVDGLRFVRAEARERGAGIRLWFTGAARSYIFVPFDSLESYEVLQRLSPKQLLELWSNLGKEQARAGANKARAASGAKGREASREEQAPAPGKPATAPSASLRNPPPGPDGLADWKPTREPAPADAAPGAPSAEPAAGEAKPTKEQEGSKPETGAAKVTAEAVQQQLRWSELLRKFPPAQGWSQAKRDEISRRFVVVGAQPSALEKEFVAQFDEWVKACRFHEIEPAKAAPARPQTRREQRRAERARQRGQRN